MSFHPPFQIPPMPKIDNDVEKLESKTRSPNVEKYTAKYRMLKEKEAEKAAKDVAQKYAAEEEAKRAERANRRFQLFNTLLGAVVGSVLTLIVEHFSEILSFLDGLMH